MVISKKTKLVSILRTSISDGSGSLPLTRREEAVVWWLSTIVFMLLVVFFILVFEIFSCPTEIGNLIFCFVHERIFYGQILTHFFIKCSAIYTNAQVATTGTNRSRASRGLTHGRTSKNKSLS